jgi:hypothetical protein
LKIIRKRDINKLNEVKQLDFYKKRFGYQHCELDGCGHELHGDWVVYGDTPYCESCFDWLIQEEKEKAEREVEKLETQLKNAQEKYNQYL